MPERYTFDLDSDVLLASLDAEIASRSVPRFIDATFARMSEQLRLRVEMLAMTHTHPFFTRYGVAHYFEGMTRQMQKDGYDEAIKQIDPGLFENDSLEHQGVTGAPPVRLALDKLKGVGPGMITYIKFGADHLPSQDEEVIASYYSGGLYIFGVLMSSLDVVKLRRELGE